MTSVALSPTRRMFLAALSAAPVVHATPRRRRAGSDPIPNELLRLAGTCVMSGWYGTIFPAALRALIRQGALGGILVARHNVGSREALSSLCARILAEAPPDVPPLIAADEEGGSVAHLSPPLPSFPSMATLGAIDDTELTYRVGAALGTELHSVGVNTDLAPVLDVRTSSENTVVLGRAFGRDPAKVARHGRALIDGLLSSGVIACAKHFPGHGDTTGDSHSVLPRVPHDLARLDAVELVPFRACVLQAPAIMLAHVVYEGVDPVRPASLSRPMIEGILRDHLGYEGVAVSDDLQMVAIRAQHSAAQASELAMRAGCDLLLIAHASTLAMSAVRHLATKAMVDPSLYQRLTVASGRIGRLRERLRLPVSVSSSPGNCAELVREVSHRAAALPGAGARVRHYHDPTLPKRR